VSVRIEFNERDTNRYLCLKCHKWCAWELGYTKCCNHHAVRIYDWQTYGLAVSAGIGIMPKGQRIKPPSLSRQADDGPLTRKAVEMALRGCWSDGWQPPDADDIAEYDARKKL
jgi:hypothetical protein